MRFDRVYNGKKFASFDPDVKLLLAVGQATTFSQTDEHYKGYLSRIVNKGLAKDVHYASEQVDELLHKLVREGYCSNGGARYRLTLEALELLLKEGRPASKDETVQMQVEVSGANDNIAPGKIETIKPISWPRLPSGDLDIKKHNANKHKVQTFGYRRLEILAELESTGGSIVTSKGRLASELRKRTESDVGSDSYKKSLVTLQREGIISISNDGNTLSLTADGQQLIALLKAYPFELKEEAHKRTFASTSLQIIELVMRETGVMLDLDMDPADLPEHTDWLLPHNCPLPLFSRLAGLLEIAEDALTRRIYEMRKIKSYIETQVGKDDCEREYITNIRVTKKGLEHALISHRKLRQREQVLDEAEVDEAQELIYGCLHLAKSLGKAELLEQLKQRYDRKSLFELTKAEFIDERASLEELFEDLRRDYIIVNRRGQWLHNSQTAPPLLPN